MAGENVGPLDRTTRIIMGIVVISYRYLGHFSGVWWDLAVMGGALIIWEGLLGYCLLYGLFGVGTKRRKRLG